VGPWWDITAWHARILIITFYLSKGELSQWEEGVSKNRSQTLFHATEMIGLLPEV
jgi:hypothetical protein